jgi:RNA polymerase sigma factor (sigma-70 family)
LKGEDGRDVLIQTEDSMKLQEGLDQLSPEDRNLVTMKYLLGYSYKDMADSLEKTSDALKVATHRAMKKLRGIMQQPD